MSGIYILETRSLQAGILRTELWEYRVARCNEDLDYFLGDFDDSTAHFKPNSAKIKEVFFIAAVFPTPIQALEYAKKITEPSGNNTELDDGICFISQFRNITWNELMAPLDKPKE